MTPHGLSLRSSVLALLAPVLACRGGPPPVEKPPAAHQGVWYVPIARAAGLDVVQTGGGESVDYIIDTIGTGAAWLDYDADGDPDLYLAVGATRETRDSGAPDRLLRNDGDGDGDGIPRFTDVTAEAGLGDTRWSFGVAVADYDNDGDPDIYLTNWGPNRLYRNDGDGTFTDVAVEAGVAHDSWGVSAAWSDVDRDSDLDLYVATYVDFRFERYPARGQPGRHGEPPCRWRDVEVCCGPRGLEGAHDVFYRNDGDPDGDGVPTFTEWTRQAGLATEQPYFGLGVLFFDADLDGDDDLYVANDSERNLFFVNRGDGTFDEASVLTGLAYNEQGYEQASMGLAAGDQDGDGLFDLVVTNFSHDYDTLYRNQGPRGFLDVSHALGLAGPTFYPLSWGVIFDDLDQDGWSDLFIANGHVYPQVDQRPMGTTYLQRNSVYANRGGTRFEEITDHAGPGLAPLANSRSLAPVDLDSDGDLDILVTRLNGVPELLRDDGTHGHWLQVGLRGSASNRDGIGALVTVESGGRRMIRQVTRNSSYAASTLPIAHFGLGQATEAEVLVRWPSGRTTRESGVAADRMLVLVEPTGE